MKIKRLQVLLEADEFRTKFPRPGEVVPKTVGELIDVLRTVDPEWTWDLHGGGPSKGRYLDFKPPRSAS